MAWKFAFFWLVKAAILHHQSGAQMFFFNQSHYSWMPLWIKKVMDVLRETEYGGVPVFNHMKTGLYGRGQKLDLKRWWQISELCNIFTYYVEYFRFIIVIRISILKANARNSWLDCLYRYSTATTCMNVYLGMILLHNLQTSAKTQWLVFRKQQLCW